METYVKRHVVVGALLLCIVGCAGPPPATREPQPPLATARFQIVQSDLAARWTFRLDRFSGEVAQLVQTSEESLSWEPMDVRQKASVVTPTHPRFEMFTSKLAVKFTFIIDTETGKTWQLASQGQGKVVWQPL
jgi:hypothetical protein